MTIKTLSVYTFRNLSDAHLSLSPGFNLIEGQNGAGKSSLLEAVYFLSHGRSFRTLHLDPLVQFGQDKLILQAEIDSFEGQSLSLGIMKTLKGEGQIKIAGEICHSAAELAALLPVQLLNSDSFELLNGGPLFKRQWMDWGMFHVEHSYGSLWKQYQRVLKQRNSAIKTGASASIRCWDESLAAMGEHIARQRAEYMADIIPICSSILARFCDFKISFHYDRGWDASFSLAQALESGLSRDQYLGYTRSGPHRADLRLNLSECPVNNVLSRGQQKWLIYSLKLAQGIFLASKTQKRCVYLLDDLPAEWDDYRQKVLIELLKEMSPQVLITGIGLSHLQEALGDSPVKMFHVEQGRVQEQDTNLEMPLSEDSSLSNSLI